MRREQLYNEAVQQVRGRRQRVETEAIMRRGSLYAETPRLAELDAAFNAAGAAATRLAALGRADEAAQKRQEADALHLEKAKLLEKLGAKGLGPQYVCTACNDTGRVDGKVCGCVRDEMLRLRREEINRQSRLPTCRFESFSLEVYPESMSEGGMPVRPRTSMASILQYCRDWAAEFGPYSLSLYMFGNAGLGKTHLALSIANQVLDAGYDVIYVSAQNAFATIANDRERGPDLFDSMLEADLLVLDDLGTEFLNAYVAGKLYELVNGRMGRSPTIYTTNICQKAMLDARYDEKITSRLLGGCERMRFWGEDLRLKRKHG